MMLLLSLLLLFLGAFSQQIERGLVISISQENEYLNLGDVQLLNHGHVVDPNLLTFYLSSVYHPDLDAIRCNNGNIADFCCTGDGDLVPQLLISTNGLDFDEIIVYNRMIGKLRHRINGATLSIFNNNDRLWQGNFGNSSSFKYIFRFEPCNHLGLKDCIWSKNDLVGTKIEAISYPSFAQVGQDEWIIDFFKEKQNGVFVDIGANDGITFSNSYVLEKYYNWSGIAIEAIPDMYTTLQKHRNCTILNVCASNFTGFTKFETMTEFPEYLQANGFNINMLSGISTTWRWQDTPDSPQYRITIDVMCVNIQEIFDHFKLTNIDYLSVDCEGCELSIINAIHWDRMKIRVLHVEMALEIEDIDHQIFMKMKSIGYKHSYIGHDWIFILP